MKTIKEIRFQNFKNTAVLKCHGPSNVFLSGNYIKENIRRLSDYLNISDSVEHEHEQIDKNLSKEAINSLGEMFISLNSCMDPRILIFLRRTIYGHQQKIPKIFLNFIKTAPKYFRTKGKKIFAKVVSMLKFQHIELEDGNHGDGVDDLVFTKNIVGVKGKNLLIILGSIP